MFGNSRQQPHRPWRATPSPAQAEDPDSTAPARLPMCALGLHESGAAIAVRTRASVLEGASRKSPRAYLKICLLSFSLGMRSCDGLGTCQQGLSGPAHRRMGADSLLSASCALSATVPVCADEAADLRPGRGTADLGALDPLAHLMDEEIRLDFGRCSFMASPCFFDACKLSLWMPDACSSGVYPDDGSSRSGSSRLWAAPRRVFVASLAHVGLCTCRCRGLAPRPPPSPLIAGLDCIRSDDEALYAAVIVGEASEAWKQQWPQRGTAAAAVGLGAPSSPPRLPAASGHAVIARRRWPWCSPSRWR